MYVRAKKLKEKLGQKIEYLQQPQSSNHTAASSSGIAPKEEMDPGKQIGFMPNSSSAKLKQ